VIVRSLDAWQLHSASTDWNSVPTVATVDVLVVGAGAAGVAAATVAAEAGAAVLIVERYGFAGGAAVAGMSGTICGLFLASEEVAAPQQIVNGFTGRFIAELERRNGITGPQRYGRTFTRAHDPLVWREAADAFLRQSGATVLFHSQVVDVLKEAEAYIGVVVATDAGMGIVRASRVVDASGDGAVAARGGELYHFGQDGRVQNPTMFFRLGDVDTDEFWKAWGGDTICPSWISAAIDDARLTGAELPRNKIWVFGTTRPRELLVNATRLIGEDGRELNMINPVDFTEAEYLGRRQVRAYYDFFRELVPGCSSSYVVDTGVQVGVRQTRTIAGIATLTNQDVVEARKTDASICRSPWPIELHSGQRPRLHWILDDYYDVPYGTLVPATGEHIIVAGRCLSAEHEALASARVTAQCFEYGHAAGVATLISLDSGVSYRRVDASAVRNAMIFNGSDLG